MLMQIFLGGKQSARGSGELQEIAWRPNKVSVIEFCPYTDKGLQQTGNSCYLFNLLLLFL